MQDALSAETLMEHICVLAQTIGPRPPGSQQENEARLYIRQVLSKLGCCDVEELPFLTNDTWGYSLILPLVVALTGNLLGLAGRRGKLAGGLLNLSATYALWRTMQNRSQPFFPLYPKTPSATLVARIVPRNEKKHCVVLIGHTDTNKHRATFAPGAKRFLLASATAGTLLPLLNGLAQFAQVFGSGRLADAVQLLTAGGIVASLAATVNDERGRFVPGANDNATAVACLLGLGASLIRTPLRHTEVWLAFTGAEETGLYGTHALLDRHGAELRDAWFIDFEMVGSEEIAFVTRHSSLSYLGTAYAPDAESLVLAQETSARHPDLQVKGRPLVINEEIAALRNRGYRGICLVGVGPDGYLENWHQYSDTVENIQPEGVEKAARFALAMMQTLDSR